MHLDASFWSERYRTGSTGWDLGTVSPPLKHFFDKHLPRHDSILIPGAGNAYEAAYLWENGFERTYVLDIAAEPLENLRQRIPDFAEDQLIHTNFFAHSGAYDWLIEQTFFCALPPNLRDDYARHTADLLKPGGKLIGLLFDFPLRDSGPPFGGDAPSYRKHFSPYFRICKLERCFNSHPSRMGKELFVWLEKR